MFRLEKDKALINRLGFNNDGLDIISKRISSNVPNGILGINIGPNKDTKNKINDFSTCLLELHSKAHYITININEDPAYYQSLSEKLENIIRESHTGVGGSQYVSVRIRLCCHQL